MNPDEELMEAKPKRRKPHRHEGQVVRGAGPAFYVVQDGKKRLVPDMAAFYRLGLRPLVKLSDAELAAIPEGEPVEG